MIDFTRWLADRCRWVRRRLAGERGDVPGWVMITVMTAALVVAILVPFRTAIVTAVQTALASVTGASGP